MVYVDKKSFCILEKILKYKYAVVQSIKQIQHLKSYSLNAVMYE